MPLGITFKNFIRMQKSSFKKIHLKMSSATSQLFCFTYPLSALTHWGRDKMDTILHTTSWNVFFKWKCWNSDCDFFHKFVPKCPINSISALVQIMAWRRPGHRPLSETMMVSLPMHICVIQPQWFKSYVNANDYQFCFLQNQQGNVKINKSLSILRIMVNVSWYIMWQTN